MLILLRLEGAEARQALEELARGPAESEITKAAREGLRRRGGPSKP